jgi:hypothetical protein
MIVVTYCPWSSVAVRDQTPLAWQRSGGYQFYFFLGLTWPGLEPTTSRTAGKHANHKTTEAFENKKYAIFICPEQWGQW